MVEGIIRGNVAKARQMLEREVSPFHGTASRLTIHGRTATSPGRCAVLGASERAMAILQRQERAIPPEILRRDGDRILALALIAYNKGDYRRAIDEFERACRRCDAAIAPTS